LGFRPEQRICASCGRVYTAHAEHARFCSDTCRARAAQPRHRLLYTPAHRARRKAAEPLVLSGRARCARGAACRWAEVVDGQMVGGLILSGQAWDLGHADGISVGGPEHSACNRATATWGRAS
jgi:hypothetical protein